MRWVFAGDSITHGAAHTIGWRDYTELFSERVRWELRRTRDMVIKTGISGWQITNLADDLDWNVLQFRPHCVSLMFGMNDCTRGTEGLAEFERQYIAVIDRIKAETGAAILLHTPNAICSSTGEPRLSHRRRIARQFWRYPPKHVYPASITMLSGRPMRRPAQCTIGLPMDFIPTNTVTGICPFIDASAGYLGSGDLEWQSSYPEHCTGSGGCLTFTPVWGNAIVESKHE